MLHRTQPTVIQESTKFQEEARYLIIAGNCIEGAHVGFPEGGCGEKVFFVRSP
jgi:hypothetical protein